MQARIIISFLQISLQLCAIMRYCSKCTVREQLQKAGSRSIFPSILSKNTQLDPGISLKQMIIPASHWSCRLAELHGFQASMFSNCQDSPLCSDGACSMRLHRRGPESNVFPGGHSCQTVKTIMEDRCCQMLKGMSTPHTMLHTTYSKWHLNDASK